MLWKLPRLGLYGLTMEVLVVDYFLNGLETEKTTKLLYTLIFQFTIYLEPGVDRYLIFWQLEACFQIDRELEDQGQV